MSSVGQHVVFSEDTVVGQGVKIGNRVTFFPNVVIEDDVVIMDGAVIGRPPISNTTINRPVDSSFRPLKIGAGSIIGANTVLYTGITLNNQVLIGDLTTVREDCIFAERTVIGRSVLVMYDTQVGTGSRILDGAILTGNMRIEEDVFVGPGVNTINDNDVYLRRYGLLPFHVEGPHIRRFALLGTGSTISGGIEVGMGAIVAPGAMVTKSVADWTVVAGIPAHYIKDVDEDVRRQILEHFHVTL